ncbi:hypothetical protein EG68_01507 [Paragonimus skrjabini miyazakii]|uniref:Uncharacterized protein n=1 Tax=Paragonimus skrjabini miyazakii TaxID=59628 RepID=A0A8S9Z642_9TREM|nr:hypothetical protein EG68_01507 [Paragonimus skrjabini miyazakii]
MKSESEQSKEFRRKDDNWISPSACELSKVDNETVKNPPPEYDEGFVEPYVIDVLEPKSWALDLPTDFSSENRQNPSVETSNQASAKQHKPLAESGSIYQSDYVAHRLNKSDIIVPQSQYKPPNGPLNSTTIYQENYQRKPLEINRPVYPKNELHLSLQKEPSFSTYQCDYQLRAATGKVDPIHPKSQYESPSGSIESKTTYNTAYLPYEIKPTVPIKLETVQEGPAATMECQTSYQADYQSLYTKPTKICKPNEYLMTPSEPFINYTTHPTDFPQHDSSLVNPPYRPRDQQSFLKGPHMETSSYRKEFPARETNKVPSFKPLNIYRPPCEPMSDRTVYRSDYSPREKKLEQRCAENDSSPYSTVENGKVAYHVNARHVQQDSTLGRYGLSGQVVNSELDMDSNQSYYQGQPYRQTDGYRGPTYNRLPPDCCSSHTPPSVENVANIRPVRTSDQPSGSLLDLSVYDAHFVPKENNSRVRFKLSNPQEGRLVEEREGKEQTNKLRGDNPSYYYSLGKAERMKLQEVRQKHAVYRNHYNTEPDVDSASPTTANVVDKSSDYPPVFYSPVNVSKMPRRKSKEMLRSPQNAETPNRLANCSSRPVNQLTDGQRSVERPGYNDVCRSKYVKTQYANQDLLWDQSATSNENNHQSNSPQAFKILMNSDTTYRTDYKQWVPPVSLLCLSARLLIKTCAITQLKNGSLMAAACESSNCTHPSCWSNYRKVYNGQYSIPAIKPITNLKLEYTNAMQLGLDIRCHEVNFEDILHNLKAQFTKCRSDPTLAIRPVSQHSSDQTDNEGQFHYSNSITSTEPDGCNLDDSLENVGCFPSIEIRNLSPDQNLSGSKHSLVPVPKYQWVPVKKNKRISTTVDERKRLMRGLSKSTFVLVPCLRSDSDRFASAKASTRMKKLENRTKSSPSLDRILSSVPSINVKDVSLPTQELICAPRWMFTSHLSAQALQARLLPLENARVRRRLHPLEPVLLPLKMNADQLKEPMHCLRVPIHDPFPSVISRTDPRLSATHGSRRVIRASQLELGLNGNLCHKNIQPTFLQKLLQERQWLISQTHIERPRTGFSKRPVNRIGISQESSGHISLLTNMLEVDSRFHVQRLVSPPCWPKLLLSNQRDQAGLARHIGSGAATTKTELVRQNIGLCQSLRLFQAVQLSIL